MTTDNQECRTPRRHSTTFVAASMSRGRALLLVLLPLCTQMQASAMAASPGAHASTPQLATAGGFGAGDPRIPREARCAPVRELTLGGEAAMHYRWALRYVDRPDDPVSGRCLGVAGRRIALQRLQHIITARGFVTTRVVLADAAADGGTLAFTVVPGRVGQVQFRPDIGHAPQLHDILPLRRGALLNLRSIEQALSELAPAPAAEPDIRILPAAHNVSPRSESDLLIVWHPRWAPTHAASTRTLPVSGVDRRTARGQASPATGFTPP